jgi:hypothetical protein
MMMSFQAEHVNARESRSLRFRVSMTSSRTSNGRRRSEAYMIEGRVRVGLPEHAVDDESARSDSVEESNEPFTSQSKPQDPARAQVVQSNRSKHLVGRRPSAPRWSVQNTQTYISSFIMTRSYRAQPSFRDNICSSASGGTQRSAFMSHVSRCHYNCGDPVTKSIV